MAFNTEFLDSLQLNDEQKAKIFEERGKELAKYSDYEELKKLCKKQNERLKELESLNPEKLKEEIAILSETHQKELNDIQEKNKDYIKKLAVKMNLNDAHDKDIVLNLMDMSKIDVDENGNIISGYEEQINNLKKNSGFLFKDNQKFSGTVPMQTNNNDDDGVVDAFTIGFMNGFKDDINVNTKQNS